MKVLHLASFNGNIGDNINHYGFKNFFIKCTNKTVTWQELEIRNFYWKKNNFDIEFANYVNKFDLLIIGGGNYFEFWVENSPTGTSIAISDNVLNKIKVPIIFNALGVDRHMGYTDKSLNKFKIFFTKIANNDKYLVSVRNDGAYETLELFFQKKLLNKIYKVLDPAFYIPTITKNVKKLYFEKNGNKIIGINLASDMPEIRFANFSNGINGFAKEFANSMNLILENNSKIYLVFIPHIFKDLEIISLVLNFLKDEYRRNRIFVSEFGTGEKHALDVLNIYRKCNLILATRFHANVIPLTNQIPTIGLYNYPQIYALYNDLNMLNNCIDIRKDNFKNILFQKSIEYLDNKKISIKNRIIFEKKLHTEILKKWLKKYVINK
jgi:polysaccharide pyruvyl transferase WcaK-like protein